MRSGISGPRDKVLAGSDRVTGISRTLYLEYKAKVPEGMSYQQVSKIYDTLSDDLREAVRGVAWPRRAGGI
jgi:hypothetical protein